MKKSGHFAGALLFGALLAVSLDLGARDANAITFGEPDCLNNTINDGCMHPNTVSLTGFRPPREGETVDGVSSGRCTGSLLDKNDDWIVILTAGHCASFYMDGLQSGALIDVGVSFDALIVRDVPEISSSAWSPAQYVLGGVPVLPEEYGPQGANAWNLHFDYAVIYFEVPAEGLETHDGTPIDLSGIDPVTLPAPGFLDTIADPTDPPILTAVGYGVGEAHNKPGEGGNQGGAVNDLSLLGVRYKTTGTAMLNALGPNRNLMFGRQNPATGTSGTCGGDSGGPMFYDDGFGEIQVAVTSSGDAICRASTIMARTDAPEAQDFIDCALTAASAADIETCGCTTVGKQGECAQ